MDLRPARFVGLLVLATLAVVAAAAAPGALAQQTPTPPAVDNTVTRIELAADGSARWTVTIRTRLDSQADVENYRAFQTRFRENVSRFLGPFESRISSVVADAARETDRPMVASAFTAETRIQEVPRRWGIVEYGFTWSAFAATEGEDLVMGDAFVGGFFLATNDTLVVVLPPDYRVQTVEPTPTDRGRESVRWIGRQDFTDGRPLVRGVPASDASPADGDDSGSGGSLPDGALPGAAIGGVALVLFVLAVLAVYVYRRGDGSSLVDTDRTDEERVLELLEDRGGRMPQATIVETFDWSTSKTSRLLSRMADEGTIEKLRIGRENLIRLPEDEE